MVFAPGYIFTVVALKKINVYALDTMTQSGHCQFHCYNSVNILFKREGADTQAVWAIQLKRTI